MSERVVLVDEYDAVIGTMEKMEAHQKGILHRAFSVFLFNEQGHMLLHQRAAEKYHCPGLWTNACCSHPRIDESLDRAVSRRLMEELGVVAKVQQIHQFIYRAEVGDGLIEHEFDHVFAGTIVGTITANKAEVAAWKFCSINQVLADLKVNPALFTPWFRIIMLENVALLKSFALS